jgi:hypothetical protein
MDVLLVNLSSTAGPRSRLRDGRRRGPSAGEGIGVGILDWTRPFFADGPLSSGSASPSAPPDWRSALTNSFLAALEVSDGKGTLQDLSRPGRHPRYGLHEESSATRDHRRRGEGRRGSDVPGMAGRFWGRKFRVHNGISFGVTVGSSSPRPSPCPTWMPPPPGPCSGERR